MILTDDQRRWWFATHPEYSWSYQVGTEGGQREEEGDNHTFSPEDVDSYVDNALDYVHGPVADLLRSVKRNFGTEENLRQASADQVVSPGNGALGWLSLTGYYPDGSVFMPRLPTTEELSRWPREVVRGFFRWLDALLQNNPLLIDPNALERHHELPKKFIKYFMDCGLNIEEFVIIMRVADHRLKPDGLHTGKGRGGAWVSE